MYPNGGKEIDHMNPFPFFLGRGRSGTTLLRAMFDSHSEMAIPQESHFVVNLGVIRRRFERRDGFNTGRYLDELLSHYGFRRWGVPETKLREAFAAEQPATFADAIRTTFSVYAGTEGKSRYGDKTPGYVMHIPLLANLFPESKFVHVIRDGRNVALSYLETGWGPRNLEENAIYWKRFVRRGRRAGRAVGPDRYREVRYEELLEDPEDHVRALCEFLDLGFEEGMLHYFERADKVIGNLRENQLRAHQNLRRPPTAGMRDWRQELSRTDLGVFETIAGGLLEELGYERAVPQLSLGRRLGARRRWLGAQAHRAGRRTGEAVRRLRRGAAVT
jgi:hypothetical protein